MRILFVYPDLTSTMPALFNFGIGYMSAVLKLEGHETKLCHLRDKSDINNLFKIVDSFKPRIIAFSSVTVEFNNVKSIIKLLHDHTDSFIICGGIHPTIHPDCLNECEGLDAICIGEGEYALLDLVTKIESGDDYFNIKNLWFKKDSEIIKNPLRNLISDLDSLPFPDRDITDYQKIIDQHEGIAEFVFNRGCPFNCTYCCNPTLRAIYKNIGSYVRQRSPEKALNEIEHVTKKYKLKSWTSEDSLFSINKKWVLQFCSGYKERFSDLPFVCLVRVETCDAELLNSLKEAGCSIVSFGVESGNPWLRKEVLNRDMSNDDIKRIFKLASDIGLKTMAHNIVGLPYEDPTKFEDTIKLNLEIKPNSTLLHIFQPFPGTPLGDLCINNKWIRKDLSENYYSHLNNFDTVLDLPNFTRDQIIECYRKFYYEISKGKIIRRITYSKIGYIFYRGLYIENPRHMLGNTAIKAFKWIRKL